METLRRLVYIPIIHTDEDMGKLGENLRREALAKLGLKSWRRKQDFINCMWEKIETVVRSIYPALGTVRLYQDGLAECGMELDIVRELAETGSRNHRLLLELIDKNAVLMGTESPLLLIHEYRLIKLGAVGSSLNGKINGQDEAASRRILKERDLYMANRINTTLKSGEAGVLFLGLLHNLNGLLDKDIKVIYPLFDPAEHDFGADVGKCKQDIDSG